MKHLQDFKFIEGVLRAGSIRKAAEDMNITASALNRRINRFEQDILQGDRLNEYIKPSRFYF